jgi:transcriptional regulator with XRE-family HTH domain
LSVAALSAVIILSVVPSEWPERFGKMVKRLRGKRGMSQEALAHAAKLHRTQISLIERGQRSPRLETIYALAKALNVDARKLIPHSRVHLQE